MLEATKLAGSRLPTRDSSTLVTSEGQFLKPGVGRLLVSGLGAAKDTYPRGIGRTPTQASLCHPHVLLSHQPFAPNLSPNAEKLAKLKNTLPITGRDKSRYPQTSKRAIYVFHNGNLLSGQSCARAHKPQGGS